MHVVGQQACYNRGLIPYKYGPYRDLGGVLEGY